MLESENPVQNKVITQKINELDTLIAQANELKEQLNRVAFSGAYSDLTGTPQIPTVPDALKNPHALKFTGAVTGNYDGSEEKTVNIPNIIVDKALSDTSKNPVQNKVVNEAINVAENMIYVLGLNKSFNKPSDINSIKTNDLNECVADSYIYAVSCNPYYIENVPYPESDNFGTCLCIPASTTSTVQIYITASVFYGESYNNGRVGIYARIKENNNNGEWTPWFSGMLGNNFYISNTLKYLNDSMLKFIGKNSVIYVKDEDKMYLYDGTELKQILKSQ